MGFPLVCPSVSMTSLFIGHGHIESGPKQGHILSCWVLGLQPRNLAGGGMILYQYVVLVWTVIVLFLLLNGIQKLKGVEF